MTQDKKFKRIVRARMAETGESYTEALHALRVTPTRESPGRSADHGGTAMTATSDRTFHVVMHDETVYEVKASSYEWDSMVTGRIMFYDGDEEIASFNGRQVTRVSAADRVTVVHERPTQRASRVSKHSWPVDGPLSPEDLKMLEGSGLNIDTLFSIPVDGPYSPSQLRELASSANSGALAALLHAVPVDGPFDPAEVVELARLPLAALATSADPGADGNLSPGEFVERARRASS